MESATRVTVVRSLQIVVSFAVQIFAFDEMPGLDQVKEYFAVYHSSTCGPVNSFIYCNSLEFV